MPVIPEHATANLRNLVENKVGSVATYSCHSGYEIRGETSTVGQ